MGCPCDPSEKVPLHEVDSQLHGCPCILVLLDTFGDNLRSNNCPGELEMFDGLHAAGCNPG